MNYRTIERLKQLSESIVQYRSMKNKLEQDLKLLTTKPITLTVSFANLLEEDELDIQYEQNVRNSYWAIQETDKQLRILYNELIECVIRNFSKQ